MEAAFAARAAIIATRASLKAGTVATGAAGPGSGSGTTLLEWSAARRRGCGSAAFSARRRTAGRTAEIAAVTPGRRIAIAAGALIAGRLADVEERVIAAAREYLSGAAA